MTNSIKKYQFKPGLPHEFEIVDLAEFYANKKKMLTHAHRAAFYHIIWFQDCTATHLVDFTPIPIQPHSLLFLNKDIIHRFDDSAALDGKVILFTEQFFYRSEQDGQTLRRLLLFSELLLVTQLHIGTEASVYSKLIADMETELQLPHDNHQSDILKNLLHNLLLHAERACRHKQSIHLKQDIDIDYVLHFKDLLDLHFKTEKQVSYYADCMNITEKRLNQSTTKVFGKSPKVLIDERTLLEAKRVIIHSSESIKRIGFSLGFEESTYFIKYFKKHTNYTPADFREAFAMA